MSAPDAWKVTVAGTDAEAKRLDAMPQSIRPDHIRKAENAAESNRRLIPVP